MPQPGQILDGYHLIRIIGSGGFGDVWLCRLQSTAEYRALKFLPQNRVRHLDRELEALKTYRTTIAHASRGGLVAIEHVNRVEDGLFYVMPLADGPTGLSPEDETWKPATLETAIETRRSRAWFSIEEIVGLFAPLATALQTLSDAGLVHRDIKPQNILFFGGEPQIADIGLVTVDEAELSRLGTPGYLAPQWYLDSKGNADMWGFAATLYHCATGNHPDYIGRPAYRWPPQGKVAMTGPEQKRWLMLIGIPYRATRQEPTERFLQFHDLADALSGLLPYRDGTVPVGRRTPRTRRKRGLQAIILVALLAAFLFSLRFYQSRRVQDGLAKAQSSAQPSTRPSIEPSPPSDFDRKAAVAVTDFHALLKKARTEFLGDGPPAREDDLKFRAVMKQLDTQTAAPMDEIKRTFDELTSLTPGLKKELSLIDQTRLNDACEKLNAAAYKPKAIAGNADEGFRGDRAYGELVGQATDFQNQAEDRNTAIMTEINELNDLLFKAANKLAEARVEIETSREGIQAAQAERDQIYGMRDAVLAKLPQP